MSTIRKKKAMLWAETSAGAGHMQVIAQMAKELGAKGFEVTVVTSSMDVGKTFDYGDAKVLELPQIKVTPAPTNQEPFTFSTHQGQFHAESMDAFMAYLSELQTTGQAQHGTEEPTLIHAHSANDSGDWRTGLGDYLAERQKILRNYLRREKPDVVVTEFWPIGRTNSNVEMVPLMGYIHHSQQRPLVFSIERDVLFTQPFKKLGADGTDARAYHTNQYVDAVIVRGDDKFIKLGDTFPPMSQITKPVYYAGYFAKPLPPRQPMPDDEREVLVSAGGGFRAQDMQLYTAAINARELTTLKDRTWRLLITPNCSDALFDEIKETAAKKGSGIIVERNRPDFKQRLANAALSISQGGYNTTLEAASCETPAIIVPALDSANGENEQVYRSQRFEEKGLLSTVSQEDANNPTLFAEKINQVLARPKSAQMSVQLDGAKCAAEFIDQQVCERSLRRSA